MRARRKGPAEDCGGAYAHELITAAADPAHPGHADAVAEFGHLSVAARARKATR